MIELTEQQKAERVKQLEKQFKEGLTKLENETGMKLVAFLEPTPSAINAKIALVPIQKNNETDTSRS